MFSLTRRFLSFADLSIATPFAFPQRKRSFRIRARLVNSPVRRDYLAATTRTQAPARGLFFNIERQWVVAGHISAVSFQHDKERTKYRNRWNQEHKDPQVEVANKARVV
jgi:hypothetical protein